MHEIGIAESVIEISEATARKSNARSIQVIALRLGEFTTVVQEALEFAFEIARQGTLAHNARLQIEIVPTIVQCAACIGEAHPIRGGSLRCEHCGFPLKIISGEEMQIDYIEIEIKKESRPWNESQYRLAS
jgi:hydrogenase nickel incorporation protein HypA/HybF